LVSGIWGAAQAGRLVLFLPVAAGAGLQLHFSLRREPPAWLCVGLVVMPLLAVLLTWRTLALRGVMRCCWSAGSGSAGRRGRRTRSRGWWRRHMMRS